MKVELESRIDGRGSPQIVEILGQQYEGLVKLPARRDQTKFDMRFGSGGLDLVISVTFYPVWLDEAESNIEYHWQFVSGFGLDSHWHGPLGGASILARRRPFCDFPGPG